MSDNLQAAIREFVALTGEKRGLAVREKEINARLGQLQGPIIDGLAAYGIDKQGITVDGEKFTLYTSTTVRARPTDMDALCAALADVGADELVKVNVNLNTLSAWVREAEQDGGIPREVMPYLEIHRIPEVRVRSGG